MSFHNSSLIIHNSSPGWQKYDLVFRLLSPMHVGWRKVSNLQQTRGYVPGKLFWAALTARLTREVGQGADGRAYQEVGKFVQENFRFTYLYPALENENGGDYQPYHPWDDDFDYLFLDSHTSTALNYENKSAEDAMLHETEFIAPYTRDKKLVYLKGNLYVRDSLGDRVRNWQPDSPIPLLKVVERNNLAEKVHHCWQDALNKLQFGGERGYGWGRVQLAVCDEKEIVDNDEVQITLPANGRLPAHLQTENLNGLAVTGPIEPLTGWERNNKNGKSNWRLSPAVICYAPGAAIPKETTFTITQNCRWKLHHS
jgi:hypothetical protein